MDAPEEGTIDEMLRWLAPRLPLAGPAPAWPPDAFALCAELLRSSGAYVRVVELGRDDQPVILDGDWLRDALEADDDMRDAGAHAGTAWAATTRAIGQRWRKELVSVVHTQRGPPAEWLPPTPVRNCWEVLRANGSLQLSALRPMERGSDDEQDEVVAVVRALLAMCAFADEACNGIGLQGERMDAFLRFSNYWLNVNKEGESLCHRVSRAKLRVLPKQHTPQRGMTLRSLSHNLALLPGGDVHCIWLPPVHASGEAAKRLELINLLLLPWPTSVSPRDFSWRHGGSGGLPPLAPPFRFFEYDRGLVRDETDTQKKKRREEFRRALDDVLTLAAETAGEIDAVVFPELALKVDELDIATELAFERKFMIIGGVGATCDDDGFQFPTNVAVADPRGIFKEGRKLSPAAYGFTQPKHHRWCLDRDQVVQYGLGGVVPASVDSWEVSDIGPRKVHFMTLDTWMTACVLLCEDLARQDPVGSAIRAVGPNLVVALLMDAPQLRQRWSARYASVLAEDPGCSVLTLTSLGMSQLTAAQHPGSKSCRTIALWRDTRYGEEELSLPEGHSAGVLSLVRDSKEEWTADARGDGRAAHFPVFAGWTSLSYAPKWPPRTR